MRRTLSSSLFCLAAILVLGSTQENTPGLVKSGQCPPIGSTEKLYSKAECTAAVSECDTDSNCQGEMKCCSNGCAQICAQPLISGCQQLKQLFQRQARMLGEETDVFVPKCRESGEFEPVQCSGNGIDEKCWCVDNRGLEVGGTRARSLEIVNCTKKRSCAGYLCRMYCPYGFELDNEGCPLCECRNPCKGVRCPAGQECSIEETLCADVLCPPLPTCKSPRGLDDQCPFGDPLTSPDTSNPFLCGVEPNKPQCPTNFVCNVMPANDYGVCCPLNEKPGDCPKGEPSDECGQLHCDSDMDCQGSHKCCNSQKCGSVCTKPGNTTLCQQHKMVVELLVTKNPSYESYIPQCDADGAFYHRQCTTNGHLCWCVDMEGAQIKGTLGPTTNVVCESQGRANALICPAVHCNLNCSLGYRSDSDGCTLCECEDPCKEINCPNESTCVVMKEDPCISGNCPPIATCLRRTEARCREGSPLVDVVSGRPVTCSQESGGCPGGHSCEIDPHGPKGICCTSEEKQRDSSDIALDLVCPNHVLVESDDCSNLTCTESDTCAHGMKCCPSEKCGSVCVHPRPPRLPTMCEYLRDMGNKLSEEKGLATLAVSIPTCRSDGSYEPVQCNGTICWCVDEFGTELVNTRVAKGSRSDCREVRMLRSCLGLLCRLGCDYGFEMNQEGCPICECRNPCQHTECGPEKECVMAAAPCRSEWCPHIPQCMPKQSQERTPPVASATCPVGNPLMFQDNTAVRCYLMNHYQQCPDTHMCVANGDVEPGICCPRIIMKTSVEKQDGDDQSEKEGILTPKDGQCPYLIPSEHDSCDFMCSSDSNCPDEEKCCSNGCGTRCMPPLKLTACQHKKLIAEHSARESGSPASQTHIPACDLLKGGFEPVQCDPSTSTCWCVDSAGFELPGTRQPASQAINCTNVEKCSWEGCNFDPCNNVKCTSPLETCRVIQLRCSNGPCPPVALCLPTFENGCPNGEPLLDERTGDPVECGPTKDQCPSSHRCHLSPLGDSSLCCPKPRDVCYQEVEIGVCKAAKPRWYFDHRKNKCQQFLYGGCFANQNNFNSKEDCEKTCPVLSECERIRERNLKIKKTVNKVVFSPKCNKKTGDWEPIQCLDAMGLCWCVNKKGDQTAGSVVRGTPLCSNRGSRNLGEVPICANGEPVYECPEDLCDGMPCFGHPNATCRIDPCGHCKATFYDERNRPVTCTSGLTACQGEIQDVKESVAWKNYQRQLNAEEEEEEEEEEESREVVESFAPLARRSPLSLMISRILIGRGDRDDEEVEGTMSISSGVTVVMSPSYRRISVMLPSFGSPVSQTVSQILPEPIRKMLDAKAGRCPPANFISFIRSMSWRCHSQCTTDADCSDAQKCCLGDCGSECKDPILPQAEDRAASPSAHLNEFQRDRMLHVHLPNCSKEGGFAVAQQQGPLSWCVDKYGDAHHDTLTVGFIKCRRNGTIIARQSSAPVCLNGATPKVCHHECLHSYCPQHPEALCVADPCKNCTVQFIDISGEPVQCQDKCLQHPESGGCSGASVRFFYNQDNRRCEEFQFSGCQGNDNNFLSLEECHQECVVLKPVCEQLREVGKCESQIHRWFYNKHAHTCQPFNYSGCGGNDNNFPTEEACMATCPDQVYCPWSTVTQELEPCSRSRICANASCPGNAELICTVDPCTCTAVFVDQTGKNFECLSTAQEPDIIIPLVTSETRCQHMRSIRQNDHTPHTYIPSCDSKGNFDPTQCTSDGECWCVDEAGIQLPDSHTFHKDKERCEFVPIKSVDVTLSFRHEGTTPKESTSPVLKRLTRQLLKRLEVETENDVGLEISLRATKVTFTLTGPTKVDAAFKLEEMVKTGGLVMQLGDSSLAADYRHSHFYYISNYVPADVEVFHRNKIPETHMAVSAAILKDNSTVTAITVVLVLSILAVLILIIVIAIYRKKHGEFPRNSLVSMAFNSPLYGFITRKSQTKASPYDCVEKKEPIPTVETEYESIQNNKNIAEEKCDSPPSYETVKKLPPD